MADLHLDFFDYKKLIGDREKRLQLIDRLSFIPTEPYLKLVYRIKTGRKLDLKHPKTFSEKLNWLKLHDVHEEYTQFVDKYAMKRYISERFGPQYVIPMLGAWDSFDEIDFDALPAAFVLKCSHDSGSIRIVKDKSGMDRAALKKFFDGRMKINSYHLGREYPYKNVKPRIIAEEYYETEAGQIISDYRFFCFNGQPRLWYVLKGRYQDETENWFDMDFQPVDIIDRTTPQPAAQIEKPTCFEEMKAFATALAEGKHFVRVDLYEDKGRFFFGELTFFPYGGFMLLQPPEWERRLGDWIDLGL